MFVLQKLILAHLIADFMLQFEELYQLKLKSLVGHVVHASCHTLVSLLLLWPYLMIPSVWVFVGAVTVVHFLQDLWKYARMGRKETFFVLFVWDQFLHLVFLCPVLLLPFSRQIVGFPGSLRLDLIYRNPDVTRLGIAFVTTAFGAAYLLHAFRTTYLAASRADHFITSFEMVHGIIERTFVTGVCLLAHGPVLPLLSPLIGLLRLLSPRLRDRTDFALSFLLSAVIGLLFRPLVHLG